MAQPLVRKQSPAAELEIRRELERAAMIPDEEDPDYQGERFLRAVYRTSRALLICRLLLQQGVSLTREAARCGEANLFQLQAPIASNTMLSSLAVLMPQPIATLPHPEMDDEEVAQLANAHFTAAMRLGYDHEDPCLRWMDPKCFRELCPSSKALLDFDSQLVTLGGSLAVLEGKGRALQWMTDVFGFVSSAEREDWLGIPIDYVRDFLSMSTDDERALMTARLESVAHAADEALDTRTKLMALRLIASVQGLTFADEGRSQRELLQLLGSARTERSLEAAKSTYAAALPPAGKAS